MSQCRPQSEMANYQVITCLLAFFVLSAECLPTPYVNGYKSRQRRHHRGYNMMGYGDNYHGYNNGHMYNPGSGHGGSARSESSSLSSDGNTFSNTNTHSNGMGQAGANAGANNSPLYEGYSGYGYGK